MLQRDVFRHRKLANGQFFRAAYVQEVPLVRVQAGNIFPVFHLHITAQNVGGGEPNLVHGIARGSERRRVGEFQLFQVVGSHVSTDGRGDDVHTFFDTTRANRLRPVDLALRAKQQLEVQRGCAGIVGGVVVIVGGDAVERQFGLFQLAAVQAGGGHGQVKNLDHGSALHAVEGHITPGDIIRRHARFLAGRAGQGQRGLLAGDEGNHFHCVANCVDVGV